MKYQIKVNDNSYDVEILDDPRQEEVQVKVNNELFTVSTVEEAAEVAQTSAKKPVPVVKPASAPAAPVAAAGPGTLKSPLPGTINAIKVSAGQKVKVNDELCVIEAMKAMNVLRAQSAGTVTKIHVTVGANVAHGAPLMDIE
mgnify:FL=1